jgi:hypothetical protein
VRFLIVANGCGAVLWRGGKAPELIRHLVDAPAANLCVFGGSLLLIIAVVGKISGKIEPGKAGRITAGVLGSILLVYGIASHPARRAVRKVGPMEAGVDRLGGNYKRIEPLTAPPGLRACKKDDVCEACTCVKPGIQGPNAMCYLKSLAPPPNSDQYCVSGAIRH